MKTFITLLLCLCSVFFVQDLHAQRKKSSKKDAAKETVDTTSSQGPQEITIDEAGAPRKKNQVQSGHREGGSKDSVATTTEPQPKQEAQPEPTEGSKERGGSSMSVPTLTDVVPGAGNATQPQNLAIDEAGAPKVKKATTAKSPVQVPKVDSLSNGSGNPLQLLMKPKQ